MKRRYLFGVCSLVLLGLVVVHSQTPQSRSREFKLTAAQRQEYQQLVKSGSGKTAIEAWARKHKLRIVSLKDYDIVVIPEPGFERPTVQEASNCDPKNCPAATGSTTIVNTLGKVLGIQNVKCKASTCKWVKDAQGRNQRICGGRKCENDGPIQYIE
jgi:hypothetical protein